MHDPEDYRSRKKQIIKELRLETKGIEYVTEYASTAMIPLVAIYTFIKEEYPELVPECDRKMTALREFYGG